jgi:biopolymer transport protein ExbD
MSSAFSAALAAVVVTLLFALYLPYTAIVCVFRGLPATPEIRAGEVYWEKPDTLVVSVQRDGSVFLGPNVVRLRVLTSELSRAHMLWPDRPLELRVDGRVTLGELEPVLSAAREAGYSAFYVFGRDRSILQLTPTDRDAT